MTVTTSSLQPASGSEIDLSSHDLLHDGKVIQTVYVKTENRTTYSAPNSGNGTAVTDLRLTIVPKRADSWIWLRWTIFYEMHHDTVFLAQENGNLIGYNTYRGNVRWSGILTPLYDNDYGSTPQVSTINWFVEAGSTNSRYYDLAVRSSSSGNHTLSLNRPNGSGGADNNEVGVSWGFAREICK